MGARNPQHDGINLLGTLAGYELYGKCRCGQERRFAIGPLARQFGGRTHFTQLGKRMVCTACGQKGIVLEKVRWDEERPGDGIPY